MQGRPSPNLRAEIVSERREEGNTADSPTFPLCSSLARSIWTSCIPGATCCGAYPIGLAIDIIGPIFEKPWPCKRDMACG